MSPAPSGPPSGDVPVRDAATVVLLRDGASPGPGSVEVWMLTRVTGMAFAAGMSVFPGGRVDPADAALPIPAAVAGDCAGRFGCDPELAAALLGAAVRETFEETGVLLGSAGAGHTSGPGADDLDADRTALEAGRLGFADLLRRHTVTLDATALRPWARWITPPGETRRYDTRFFVVAVPEGAEPRNLTSESSVGEWVPSGLALEQAQRGERKLLPPTAVTLAGVAEQPSVAGVLAAADRRDCAPVQPTISLGPDGSVVAELPDGTAVHLPRTMLR